MHIPVFCADGEAKFRLEPLISVANNHGLSSRQLNELKEIIEEKKDDIIEEWNRHFRS